MGIGHVIYGAYRGLKGRKSLAACYIFNVCASGGA